LPSGLPPILAGVANDRAKPDEQEHGGCDAADGGDGHQRDAGGQLRAGVVSLVRRPFHGKKAPGGDPAAVKSLVMLGILAVVVGIIYLAGSIHSPPLFFPGHGPHGRSHDHMPVACGTPRNEPSG
jgi:hypothetical protein